MFRRAARAGLLAAAAFSGCALLGEGGDGFRAGAEARAELRGLQRDYEMNRSEDFFARFDTGVFPDFHTFRDRVKTFLLRSRNVTMRFIVDRVVEGGDEVSLRARWDRSYVDENGSIRLEKGACEFIFHRRPSGGLAVLNIRGDSPF